MPGIMLIWLLPCGRFALWFVSTLGLAQLATALPPRPDTLSLWDAGVLAYLLGWLKAELSELRGDRGNGGKDKLHRYLTEAFNVLDLALMALMALLLVTRYTYTVDCGEGSGGGGRGGDKCEGSLLAQASLPCQAMLALAAWLRLMQVLLHDACAP